jgi:hypothetical protein
MDPSARDDDVKGKGMTTADSTVGRAFVTRSSTASELAVNWRRV